MNHEPSLINTFGGAAKHMDPTIPILVVPYLGISMHNHTLLIQNVRILTSIRAYDRRIRVLTSMIESSSRIVDVGPPSSDPSGTIKGLLARDYKLIDL